MTLRDDFYFPEVYMELEKQGCFDVNKFKSRDNFINQNYVWFYDMEWLSHDKIINYNYEDYQSRAVVPFAMTGGGDIWGWYLDCQNSMPIVLCPHNDDEGIFYANCFEAAVFRHILEFASKNNFCIDVGESWEMDLKMARNHLSNWKSKFGRWFAPEWLSEINRLMTLDIKLHQVGKYPSEGDFYLLITPEEYSELTKKYLAFNLFDQTFVWTNDN